MKRLAAIKQFVGNEDKAAKPPRLMRCISSAGTNNPYPLSVKKGQRLSEDHELVKRWPWAFLPDGLGDEVYQAAAAKLQLAEVLKGQAIADKTMGIDRAEREKLEAAVLRKPIPLERQRLCIKWAGDVGASVRMANWKNGEPRGIRAGEIADAKWSLVKEFPDRFVPIKAESLAVENALVCIADEGITQIAPDGSVARRIRRGQMVDKNDPLVAIHPTMWAPAAYADELAGYREPIFVTRPDQVTEGASPPRTGREPA